MAALLTGCRYGELAALLAEDFAPDGGTLHIRTSKSGRGRHVALTEEGQLFFQRLSLGRGRTNHLLTRNDGRLWGKSEQQRPLAAACVAAGLSSAVNFHALRHTYASRLAMKGVPLQVIAVQLGHRDTRMVEKHYGHLAPNYVADTVRAAFGTLGLVEADNVVPLAGRG